MNVDFHAYKLIPPRPSFAMDMSEEEMAVMGRHGAYWTGLLEQGKAVGFGPVIDPSGTFGIAIVESGDEAEVRAFGDADPAITSGIGMSYDVFPMPAAVVRPHAAA